MLIGLLSVLAIVIFPNIFTDDSLLQLNTEEELRHNTRVMMVCAQGIIGVEPKHAVNVNAYESLAVMWDATILSGTCQLWQLSDNEETVALLVLAMALSAFVFGWLSKDQPTATT